MIHHLFFYSAFMLLACAHPAFAQEASALDAVVGLIPNSGVILALVMAAFGVASAFVSDDKIPGFIKPVWNILASNYNKAKNDPGAQ